MATTGLRRARCEMVGAGVCLVLSGCDPGRGASDRRQVVEAPSSALAPAAVPSVSASPAVREKPDAAVAEDPDCPRGFRCDLGALTSASPPHVTEIRVRKQAHRLHLVSGDLVVRSYRVALGWGGLGQKLFEGDGTTPIGTYAITGKYPSKWHTYLALDYPREPDKARYEAAVLAGTAPKGRTAGSAIAIHGHRANQFDGIHKAVDWTLGCVALDNGEIDEVARVVEVGTPVVIDP